MKCIKHSASQEKSSQNCSWLQLRTSDSTTDRLLPLLAATVILLLQHACGGVHCACKSCFNCLKLLLICNNIIFLFSIRAWQNLIVLSLKGYNFLNNFIILILNATSSKLFWKSSGEALYIPTAGNTKPSVLHLKFEYFRLYFFMQNSLTFYCSHRRSMVTDEQCV